MPSWYSLREAILPFFTNEKPVQRTVSMPVEESFDPSHINEI